MLGSECWVIFYIFTQVLGIFFNPNAGFRVLGYFLYFYPGTGYFFNPNAGFRVLGYFLYFYPGAGPFFFFLPNCWVELVSSETAQQRIIIITVTESLNP